MLPRWRPLSCRFWPVMTSLVVLIVLLQVLHMALLSRLEAHEARAGLGWTGSGGPTRHLQGRMLQTVLGEMEERVASAHRLDRSGTYHLIDNFLTSEHVLTGRNQYDVSLVTQCSSNHLHHLSQLVSRWNGPVSVAVFTYDDDFLQAAATLLKLHFCDENIFRHVSFHLVYPISRAPKHLEGLSQIKVTCGDRGSQMSDKLNAILMSQTLGSPKTGTNYNNELAFPNNLLRNLAINYAQTPSIFLTDVDMLPSRNLRTEFHKFMKSNLPAPREGKSNFSTTIGNNSSGGSSGVSGSGGGDNVHSFLSAYVVPAFEVKEGSPIPETKEQLLKMWLKGLVRPFYWGPCNKCHRLTNYERWRGSGVKGQESLSVAYSVERTKLWEPFYIAKTSLPLYDERFKQYGFNRISQICEMYLAGFSFHVLDTAFLVHKGFKVKGEFHLEKDEENKRNRQLYKKFREELKVKYPKSTRQCEVDG